MQSRFMQTEDVLISPPLFKKNELKALLTERMKRDHASFRSLALANGVFHFQRPRPFRGYGLKEALHLVFSFTGRTLHASVSSRLNPIHTLTPVYNRGFINPHVDLVAIKNNNSVFPSDETAYRFSRDPETVVAAIDSMFADFNAVGAPYFIARWNELQTNPLINGGIDIIKSWDLNKALLRNELDVQLRKAKLIPSNVRHPLINEIKERLLAIPGQPAESYEGVPRLAFELMELYCNRRIVS
jgi:hypothetical protein